jgi:protoporphyrinogen/coproporphyrinogen III oxidase
MAEPKQVAVIGGGISGLACAYKLRQLGVAVTLFEARDHSGGLIETHEKDGYLFESGPQSFQGTPSLLALIHELGIEPDLCKAPPQAPRFILRHGKLQKIPMSPQAVLTSSLLSAGARWNIATEGFRSTKPPSEEESVAQFVRRKFGHEILEYLVAPFVSGVYAGDPETLSLRAAFPSLEEWEQQYGSVVRGMIRSRSSGKQRTGPPPLCSFGRGVGTLTQAIAGKLGASFQPGARTEAIERIDSESAPHYKIGVELAGKRESALADALVVATPAHVASHLVARISFSQASSLASSLGRTLSGIAYAGVAVVAAGYYSQQVSQPSDGFGVLIPRSEKYRTLGTVWNSSLFPGRAHDGQIVMTSFIGGATDPAILEKSDDEIAAIVHAENARILGITGPPVATCLWKHPKALPQYNLGHLHVVAAIREAERATPGLFFAGNYLKGPSIPACIDNGFQTAEAVKAYLQ